MKTIEVNASKKYKIHIGTSLLDRAGELISGVIRPHTAAIITDDRVSPLYADRLEKSLDTANIGHCRYVFPHGEKSKNLNVLGEILEFCAENGLCRADALIALGGGVCGDITGLSAALYMRGISFVQIPTTLLAQVDSSVGGKTAVDLSGGKNLAGAFYQPDLVICDTDTLKTLDKSTFSDGCAEVLKYGIGFSRELFTLAAKERFTEIERAVCLSVGIKKDIVAADEFDRGERQKLNLGHTLGHAIEKCSRYTVTHGSAVAIGCAIICRALRPEISSEVEKAFINRGLPVKTGFSAKELFSAARGDKKREGENITLIVPTEIGKCECRKIPFDSLYEIIERGL